MAEWLESYRGSVTPWECDVTEHLTVAYYYDRFADAVLTLLQDRGVGVDYMREQRAGFVSVACDTRYLREFRKGDILHIESGLTAVEEKRITAVHRVIDSANGDICSEMVHSLLYIDLERRRAAAIPPALASSLSEHLVSWEGEPFEPKPTPEDDAGYVAAGRDTVRPWEIDIMGHLGFQFYVHRFSSAGSHLFSAMGLDPRWMSENRHGFSTFDFRLRFHRELSAGDLLHVKSGLLHLGNSSIRIHHRLYNSRNGELSAELDQAGVLLDLDARRPARVPDGIREQALALVVSPES